jgi:serine/threonine protein kinase
MDAYDHTYAFIKSVGKLVAVGNFAHVYEMKVADVLTLLPHVGKIGFRGVPLPKSGTVAVKVTLDPIAEFSVYERLWNTPARAAIPTPYFAGWLEDGTNFIVMELVKGRPVGKYMTPREVAALEWALHLIEKQGIMIGDFHAGNFLIQPNGRVKIFDLGNFTVVKSPNPTLANFQANLNAQRKQVLKKRQNTDRMAEPTQYIYDGNGGGVLATWFAVRAELDAQKLRKARSRLASRIRKRREL